MISRKGIRTWSMALLTPPPKERKERRTRGKLRVDGGTKKGENK